MAEWVEKGSIKGPPGEIPDVSDFLRDGDVSSAISGSAEKVASDKAVKDYVDAQVSAEATSRQEQDSSLQTQIGGKANVEHSHEMDDVTGLNDKISEIETNVSGKANATHTHTTAQVDGLDTKLSGIDDDIAAKADKVHKHAIADVTDLQTTLDGKAASVHTHEIANVNGLQGALDSKADASHEHSADNITSGTMSIDRIPNIPDAKIDGMSATKLTGTVPQANLPSYVDDVIEAENYASLPPTGEAGKIYVDKETNKTYRWGGSAYVEISASLALGETSATAFRGDYGKVAYDHAQAKGSEFAAGLYKITTNAEGHVTSATAVAKSDITALGIPSEDTDTTYTAGAGLGLSGTEFSIADSGVTTAKLADDSVTADKIADGVIPDVSEFITSEEAAGAYAAKSHTHDDRYYTETEVDGFLGGKANTSHTHTIENVTGLQDALDEKADVDSVTLTSLGVTATAEELNYMDGVTSNVQTQLDGKADSVHTHANATTSTAGFMSAEDKTKLEGIETGANKYVHPASTAGAKASGLYKIATDANGHVTGATAVEKTDITALGIPAEDTDTTYTAGSGLTLSGTEFSIASKGVTADKIADGVITTYDVATTSENGLMSSEDKKSLDDLTANAIKTDSSGFVQKSPIKFRGYEDGIELDITSKTETSFDLDMRSADGTSLVTITGDELFGAKTSAITMSGDATFTMNDKDIKGITDVVGSSADGTKLATDKAVKDAIAAIEIPDPLPAGGTDGQVLTKTADGEAWEDIPDYENATTEYDGLMSSADKKKLDGIENNANNYTHPASAAGAKASGLYKVQTDANGHVIGAVNVVKGDITALGVPAQDTTYVDATGSASGLMSASDKTKLDGLDTALAGKSDVGHTHEIANINGLQTALDGKAASGHKHDASDITTGTMSVDRLPSITDDKISSVSAEKITGTIPSENLPSYVDDVIEVENHSSLPPTGEAGKIYVDKQTNKTYRWGGSDYVEISASLALGSTSSTAFRGDYGEAAYNHAVTNKGSEFASGLYKITTNAEGHVTAATSVVKGDITALGIPAQDTTYVDATTGASGLMSAADKTKLDGIAEGADKLPDGGAEGQVLTKTSGGEAWADVPQPDMTGVVKASGDIVKILTADGAGLSSIGVGELDFNITAIGATGIDIQSTDNASIGINASRGFVSLGVTSDGPSINLIPGSGASANLTIGSKSVTSITDAIADSPAGSALVTDKAVADYVDAHGMPSVVPISKGGTGVQSEDALVQLVFNSTSTPQASATQYGVVKFASDEDFKAYMGSS